MCIISSSQCNEKLCNARSEIIIHMVHSILGLLIKSLGQILRVSATMHVLFHMDSEEPLPDMITESAIEAAIDFVEVCCQHTAYLTGCGDINQEVDIMQTGI